MDVYGHRGAAGEAPENTIAGCRHAIERGARHLELDLRLSADNKLMVIHDAKVNRTTDHRGSVSRYNADDLWAMDGRRTGPPWPRKRDCGIPTLAALLDATPEIKGYYLEVKTGPGTRSGLIIDALGAHFPDRRSARNVVITSLNRKFLTSIRQTLPHVPLGLISVRGDIINTLRDFHFDELHLQWSAINPVTVLLIKSLGIRVAGWTINDPQIVRNLHRLKVNSIITDYPSMALPLVASLERK